MTDPQAEVLALIRAGKPVPPLIYLRTFLTITEVESYRAGMRNQGRLTDEINAACDTQVDALKQGIG